jgi:hypothetical protein
LASLKNLRSKGKIPPYGRRFRYLGGAKWEQPYPNLALKARGKTGNGFAKSLKQA